MISKLSIHMIMLAYAFTCIILLNGISVAQAQTIQKSSLNELNVALPHLKYGTPAPNNLLIVVSILSEDDIYVGTQQVKAEQVAGKVQDLLKKGSASKQVAYV
jgi:biopolymer transport protein ExbD